MILLVNGEPLRVERVNEDIYNTYSSYTAYGTCSICTLTLFITNTTAYCKSEEQFPKDIVGRLLADSRRPAGNLSVTCWWVVN